jgi:hypothetical protein
LTSACNSQFPSQPGISNESIAESLSSTGNDAGREQQMANEKSSLNSVAESNRVADTVKATKPDIQTLVHEIENTEHVSDSNNTRESSRLCESIHHKRLHDTSFPLGIKQKYNEDNFVPSLSDLMDYYPLTSRSPHDEPLSDTESVGSK